MGRQRGTRRSRRDGCAAEQKVNVIDDRHKCADEEVSGKSRKRLRAASGSFPAVVSHGPASHWREVRACDQARQHNGDLIVYGTELHSVEYGTSTIADWLTGPYNHYEAGSSATAGNNSRSGTTLNSATRSLTRLTDPRAQYRHNATA